MLKVIMLNVDAFNSIGVPRHYTFSNDTKLFTLFIDILKK
jgi:hypothetical protein